MPMNNPRRVLIVDDEAEILDIYKSAIARTGLDVFTASNGEEGVAAAIKEHPDLILLDVKMPVMDGPEALVKLRENPATKDIKVVFLTAFSDPNNRDIDIKLAKDGGAVDFLKKGAGLKEIVAKVQRYLEQ